MTISPFFLDLRSAYQSELDDLTFDSEGNDVLRQRLADKRQELPFLVKMMELSPEMVAVIFHKGLSFRLPAVMDHLLSHEADEFPDWSSLSDGVAFAPWAQSLADVVLQEPGGEWFLSVAAGLEYMAGKPGLAQAAQNSDEEDEDDEEDGDSPDEFDRDENGDDLGDGQSRKEAGDDWMVGQGFDRKD
jgi:hypothetical protein